MCTHLQRREQYNHSLFFLLFLVCMLFFFFKQKTAYEIYQCDWSSDVCSSDLCDMAHAFETKLIRGFSFYHPRGTDPQDYIPQAVDQLGQIAETCHRSDLTFGLEIEANLVGQTDRKSVV